MLRSISIRVLLLLQASVALASVLCIRSYLLRNSHPGPLPERLLRLGPAVSLFLLLVLAVLSVLELPVWKRVLIIVGGTVLLLVTYVAGPVLLIRE
jgi:hypothetical protein